MWGENLQGQNRCLVTHTLILVSRVTQICWVMEGNAIDAWRRFNSLSAPESSLPALIKDVFTPQTQRPFSSFWRGTKTPVKGCKLQASPNTKFWTSDTFQKCQIIMYQKVTASAQCIAEQGGHRRTDTLCIIVMIIVSGYLQVVQINYKSLEVYLCCYWKTPRSISVPVC